MKLLLLKICICIPFLVGAQQDYVFDHLITYDFYWDYKTKEADTYYYLTNSQNNDYTAVLTKKDSVTFKFDFIDHNGLHIISYITKNALFKSNNFTLNCVDVRPHENMNKALIKRLNFVNKKDTIIGGKTLNRYVLRPKKYKPGLTIEHFIIDSTYINHLPILRHATTHGTWKVKQNIPNGIIVEKFLLHENGKKRHRLVLKSTEQIEKSFYLPIDCDFTKTKKPR